MTKLRSRFAVAVVLAPLTLLIVGCGDERGGSSADTAPDPAATAPARPTTSPPTNTPATAQPTPARTADPVGIDYVLNGVWHQADGDEVDLPARDYFGSVIWNDHLVATRSDGEVYAVADVIAADGSVIDTLDTTSTVVVNEAGTTLAWVDTDGDVMTAWEDEQVELGQVDLAAPGETVAYFAAAVTGGPSCYEADGGCIVYLNSGVGKPRVFDSHGVNENPMPFAVDVNDVSGDLLSTYRDEISDDGSCGGLIDLSQENNEPEWETCDHEGAQISPDSTHVIGLPSYYDGLGISELAVLDAATGAETGRHAAAPSAFISQWSWSTDGRVVFDRYDGGRWQLIAMTVDGEITEIGESVPGEEFDSPFTLIQH